MQHQEQIRRRADGSIDTDFYARRASNLRKTAIRETPGLWTTAVVRTLRRWQLSLLSFLLRSTRVG